MASILSNEFWDRAMDPRTRGFPLMVEGTWKILAICIGYVVVAKLWNPSSSKSTADLRPWLLVQNGFAFGCHGAGLAIALMLSNFGMDGLDCSPLGQHKWSAVPTFDYIKGESIVHLSSVLLFIRIFLLTEGLTLRLLKDKPISNRRILNDITLLFFCYVGCKYLPGGPSLFFAVTYMTFYTFTYGYHTLKFGSFSTNDMLDNWNNIFIGLQLLWSLATLAHSIFLLTSASCNSSVVRPLGAVEFLYSIGTFCNFCHSLTKIKHSHKITAKSQ